MDPRLDFELPGTYSRRPVRLSETTTSPIGRPPWLLYVMVNAETRYAQADAVGAGNAFAPLAVTVLGDGVLRVDALEPPCPVEPGRVAGVAAVAEALFLDTARAEHRVVPLEAAPRQLGRARRQ